MRALSAIPPGHPGSLHLIRMLDHFKLDGPNGTHDCLVLELLGPSVPDLLEAHFQDERLPGKLAKSIAKQALLGLDLLHQQKIGHGGGLASIRFQLTSLMQLRPSHPQLNFYSSSSRLST